MKFTLIYVFILISSTITAQGFKKIVCNHDNSFKEVYYVFKAHREVKHGKYQVISPDKKLFISGQLTHNTKEGRWEQYLSGDERPNIIQHFNDNKRVGTYTVQYFKGDTILTQITGQWTNDKPSGIWKFYNTQQEVIRSFDYDSLKMIDCKIESEDTVLFNRFKLLRDDQSIDSSAICFPIYLGDLHSSTNDWLDHQYGLSFPALAMKKKVNGDVIISLKINADGSSSDYKVIKSVGYGCDEEALRFMMSKNPIWIPAYFNGEYLPMEYHFTVPFYSDNLKYSVKVMWR